MKVHDLERGRRGGVSGEIANEKMENSTFGSCRQLVPIKVIELCKSGAESFPLCCDLS